MISILPLDIVVFNSQDTILHSIIEWRCLDSAVHCAIVASSTGLLYDPDFKGIKKTHLLDYTGRKASIHRYQYPVNTAELLNWCDKREAESTGYDYAQWLFGFVFGIRTKAIADDPNKWTCAELPYWMFQENMIKLTPRDEVLPMPRLFRYNPYFTTIFEGEL